MKLKTQRKVEKKSKIKQASEKSMIIWRGALKIFALASAAAGPVVRHETRKDKELLKKVNDALPEGDVNEEKVQAK